jgi:hypothetical protein
MGHLGLPRHLDHMDRARLCPAWTELGRKRVERKELLGRPSPDGKDDNNFIFIF